MAVPTEQELNDLIAQWEVASANCRSTIEEWEGLVPGTQYEGLYEFLDKMAEVYETCAQDLQALMG